MGLCSAERGSCPTFAGAFLFLRVVRRKQQWEGVRAGKQSPSGETAGGRTADVSPLSVGFSPHPAAAQAAKGLRFPQPPSASL